MSFATISTMPELLWSCIQCHTIENGIFFFVPIYCFTIIHRLSTKWFWPICYEATFNLKSSNDPDQFLKIIVSRNITKKKTWWTQYFRLAPSCRICFVKWEIAFVFLFRKMSPSRVLIQFYCAVSKTMKSKTENFWIIYFCLYCLYLPFLARIVILRITLQLR